MRVTNVLKSTIYGGIGYAINLLLSFFARSIFIQYLGVEYSGVNSLFNSILTALNLAELGFASAIAYSLYKPLNSNDEQVISAIMNYMKKVYLIVAGIIGGAGLLCVPFLQYLIKEDISTLPFDLAQLRIYFLIYLLNTVCSYFLAYKRTLLTADQKNYVINNVDNSCNIALNIFQIIALWITKNYYAFLAVMLVKTICNNLIIQKYVDKKYKYLKRNKEARIEKPEKQGIIKNVKALMVHKISSMVVTNSISIVISAMVGIAITGIYSNYVLITSGVSSFLGIFFNAMVASIGNYCVEKDEEEQYKMFKKINFLITWITLFTFTCFVCVFNPFIEVWLGSAMLFPIQTVVLISAVQSMHFYRRSILMFRDAKGMFRFDQFVSILEAVCAIGLAVLLGVYFGIFGILLGYLIASMLIAYPLESLILYKKGFHKNVSRFLLFAAVNVFSIFILSFLTYKLTELIQITGILGVLIKLCISALLPSIVYFFVTFWMSENKFYRDLIKNLIKKKKEENENEHI